MSLPQPHETIPTMEAPAMEAPAMEAPTDSADSVNATDTTAKTNQQTRKGLKFWAIFVAAGLAALLPTMEATIISTALPDIIASLGGGNNYIWVANGYFLTMASLQPMFAQLANVFGRRWPMIVATSAFVLGSGICGGSTNTSMLIAGRVIQGVGAAGNNVLVETVICDLVPLRERGNYMSIMFGLVSLGTALGPFFGGLIVTYSSWRWVFYMILPAGGLALVMQVAFLHVNYDKSNTLSTKLRNLDWFGNAVFIGASCSVLVALSWAGAVYPWSSFQVLVPLIVGMVALAGFIVLEGSPLIANPIMPLHLFTNRTSATTIIITFFHAVVTVWVLYFLPVYFQGVLGAAPDRSGTMLLPTILILVPFAIAGGFLLTKFGRYKPIILVGFVIMVAGFGSFTLLDENSNTGSWVGFQAIEAAGAGLVIPCLLPAVMAPLTERDTALATGTWAFMRSFGFTWGISISAAVFNNRAGQLAGSGIITDTAVAAQLMGGGAYQVSTAQFLDSLSAQTRAQVVQVLSSSLQRTWQIAIALTAAGFLLVALLKEIPLRKELDTEFGIAEKGAEAAV